MLAVRFASSSGEGVNMINHSLWVFPLLAFLAVTPVHADESDPWLRHPKQSANGVDYWSASIESDSGDILVVACAPSNKGIRVNFIPSQPYIYPDKIVKAHYRVDEGKSIRIDFHSTDDERGTFVLMEPAQRMVRAIYHGKEKLDYQDSNVLAEFSLTGAREALGDLERSCPHLRLD
jgi:hypothetical protein